MKRVMIFETGKKPYLKEVDGELESLQDIVGGYIEVPFISKELNDKNIAIVCNDEGLLQKLNPSLALLKGDFVAGSLVGTSFAIGVKDDEFIGLTNEQIEYLNSIISFGTANLINEDVGLVDIASISI